MDPSAVEFYAQIIRFLQCVNLTSKFAGQAPNGYEIITHGSNRFGKFVRYNYNTLTEKIGEEKLDLFDYKTGLKNYRVHMGQVGEEILTALSGNLNDKEHCFVFDKKYIEDDCGKLSQYVIELLDASIAKIGCKPGITRSQNILYPLNRKEPVVYSTEVKTQFNCESKFGVFGNKIVFKNKGEDVCKEVDWAADHVWKATQCSNHEQYTLNSKKFQFFSMRYLTIKFESGTCKRPTEPSAQFLDSTYIKYFYLTDGEQEALGITTATEKESKDERNWMLIGGISFGCVLTVAALATAAAAAIFRKCKKWKQP